MKIEFKSLNQEVSDKLDRYFKVKNCFIEVHPGQALLPIKYTEISEMITNLPIRQDDLFLVSYPRTGSTWAQELIWLLGNKLDFEGAKKPQFIRSPLLELSALFAINHPEFLNNSLGNSVDFVDKLPSPRYIKTHLPMDLLPREVDIVKPKIIYTARNPKDLCVSYYHYCMLIHNLDCSFEEFCELFLTNNTPIGPVWNHMLKFWNKRNEENILFIKYEDMKRDYPTIIRKCAKFMNTDYELTDSDMTKLCEYLKFDHMQKNPAVNLEQLINPSDSHSHIIHNNGSNNNSSHTQENTVTKKKFIRKGEIGDWKHYMSDSISRKFDKWIEENSAGTGLSFDYE